jgi:hypothetical protein
MKTSLTKRLRRVALIALLALAPQGARAQEPSADPKPAAGGAITGRVVGEGGEPLAQVPVFVSERRSGPRPGRTTVTDDEGNFAVRDLPPGLYTVGAAAPGYYVDPGPQADGFGSLLRPGDSVTIRLTKGGVITGTVTGPDGGPLVGLGVRAFRVRALEGEPAPAGFNPLFGVAAQTDDRGVYRIYGLPPGVYVVATGGGGFGPFSPYGGDSPTFYPSGTRDTAAELPVRAGQETTGVDIRYREERGHRVTGAVEFPADLREANVGVGVSLTHAATGTLMASTFVNRMAGEPRFQLDGVSDGDYELRASVTTPDGVARASPPQKVSVRGADVTGLKLTLAPLATLSGTLFVEPPAALLAQETCKGRRPRLLPQEVFLLARREAGGAPNAAPRPDQFTRSSSAPDETGAFSLRNLEAGRYRLDVRPLDESLYVREVRLPAPPNATTTSGGATRAGAAKSAGASQTSHDAVTLRAGQQLSGAVVRVAFGAASVAGRLTSPAAPEGSAQDAPRARVYLVPAEPERDADLLRYAETSTAADGSFAFRNVAPGRYLLVARAPAPAAHGPEAAQPFLDAGARAALRREAEAARFELDLQPCQSLTGLALNPAAPSAPQKDSPEK